MTARSSLTMLLTLALTVAPAAARGAKPELTDLSVGLAGDRVEVSYRLVDCVDAEVLERIDSGIPIRFKHKVELVEKRPGLFSGDRVYSRTLLETAVQYDSLTERFELTRTTEFKSRHDQPELDPRVESVQTTSREEMRTWLTVVAGAPLLLPQPDAETDYHVRIEVSIGRRWFLLIIPSSQTVKLESPVDWGD